MITQLLQVAKYWLSPDYPLRQAAIVHAAEYNLSAESFALGLDWIFSQWNLQNLTAVKNPFPNIKHAVQIVASNTPAMMAQVLLQGALLPVPQWIKVPQNCPTFASLLIQSFAEVSSMIAEKFYLNTWRDNLAELHQQLAQTDLVIAYGSDENLAEIKQHLGPHTKWIAHGFAQSAAVIFNSANQRESLQKLAWDMLSYDQRGCLSPRVVWVQQDGALTPAECAKLFAAEIIPALAAQLPGGGLLAGEAAAIMHAQLLYRFRGKVYTGSDWTVCYDEHMTWPSEAFPRFLPFKPFSNLTQLRKIASPIKDSLISIGYAGLLSPAQRLFPTLAIKTCQIGDMQRQLLFW